MAWFIPLHKQCHNHLQTQAFSQKAQVQRRSVVANSFQQAWLNKSTKTGAEQSLRRDAALIKTPDKCLQNVCEKQQFVIFPGPGCGPPVVSVSDT